MEAEKTNKTEEKKTTTPPPPPNKPLGGLDLGSLVSNPDILEVIKHLLSGGGAVAVNYYIWIKPLQEKVESLTEIVKQQEKRITDLEDKMDELPDEAEKEKQKEQNQKESEYFNIKRKQTPTATRSFGKYHRI